ncbi:hypothetical protein [Curtobacterium oceanosedimentum]|uniref:hypothetical protein n=1 Tax=Curtobacterium oceanosedimentum TaxID=465820 RepID=UPI0033913B9A
MTATGHDLAVDGYPHGTPEGYRLGCRGSVCPNGETNGQSCRAANMRANGDWQYAKLVREGAPLEVLQQPAHYAAEPETRPSRSPRTRPLRQPATRPEPKPRETRPAGPQPDAAPSAPQRAVTITHGTPGGYNHHGCRCAACRGWQREYARERAARKRAAAAVQVTGDPTHGTAVLQPAVSPGEAAAMFDDVHARTSEVRSALLDKDERAWELMSALADCLDDVAATFRESIGRSS